MKNEMWPVTIYKDTTGQYTEEECDLDNMIEIPVPPALLFQWWIEDLVNNKTYWGNAWQDGDEESFARWYKEESIADDADTLYSWLCDHNYFWKRLDK